jgi:hypothetical protein
MPEQEYAKKLKISNALSRKNNKYNNEVDKSGAIQVMHVDETAVTRASAWTEKTSSSTSVARKKRGRPRVQVPGFTWHTTKSKHPWHRCNACSESIEHRKISKHKCSIGASDLAIASLEENDEDNEEQEEGLDSFPVPSSRVTGEPGYRETRTRRAFEVSCREKCPSGARICRQQREKLEKRLVAVTQRVDVSEQRLSVEETKKHLQALSAMLSRIGV